MKCILDQDGIKTLNYIRKDIQVFLFIYLLMLYSTSAEGL